MCWGQMTLVTQAWRLAGPPPELLSRIWTETPVEGSCGASEPAPPPGAEEHGDGDAHVHPPGVSRQRAWRPLAGAAPEHCSGAISRP